MIHFISYKKKLLTKHRYFLRVLIQECTLEYRDIYDNIMLLNTKCIDILTVVNSSFQIKLLDEIEIL